MTAVTLSRPWLSLDLGAPVQVLSWAVNRPGLVTADRIPWRQVRNADLPPAVDARAWLDSELAAIGAGDAVAVLTSCDIAAFTQATATVGSCTAQAVVTVGLANAERVGRRMRAQTGAWGTVSIAVKITCGLTQTALLESTVAQARTAASIDAALPLRGGVATGTGTDCIAIAAPQGARDYAGLRTDVGEAVGAAVYRATLSGTRRWMQDHRSRPPLRVGHQLQEDGVS